MISTVWLGASNVWPNGKFTWRSDLGPMSVPLDWWFQSRVPESSKNDDLCLVISAMSQLSGMGCRESFRFICQICEFRRNNTIHQTQLQQQQEERKECQSKDDRYKNNISNDIMSRTTTTYNNSRNKTVIRTAKT